MSQFSPNEALTEFTYGVMMQGMRARTPAEPPKEFPNRLREWRQARGLTLAQLASHTQQKLQSVARHETGENQMTLDQMETYAKVLRIKAEELLKGSLRVNPKLRGLVDIFDTLPAEDQDRFLRMGYAFAEPNVRFLPQPDAQKRTRRTR